MHATSPPTKLLLARRKKSIEYRGYTGEIVKIRTFVEPLLAIGDRR